jgi:hypothetical protein
MEPKSGQADLRRHASDHASESERSDSLTVPNRSAKRRLLPVEISEKPIPYSTLEICRSKNAITLSIPSLKDVLNRKP